MNDDLQALRRQLQELRELHDRGAIDASQYEARRTPLERRLVETVLVEPTAAPGATDATVAPAAPAAAPAARPSGRLLALVSLAVVAVAVIGYSMTGSPGLAGWPLAAGPQGPAAPASAVEHAQNLQRIEAMVDKLAARMKESPDDAEGWSMLARSYAVLGRHAEAVPAYERAVALREGDPQLLADYADALAMRNNGDLAGEPLRLIERALKIDPRHLKALSLAGTAAFDRKDYASAVRHWSAILEAAPPGSDYIAQVQASIDEARQLGGLPAAPAATSPAPQAAAQRAAAVSGTVSLAPALAAQAAPDDTVFVFARAADGPRMPLAILRKQVRDLPFEFTLDDSLSMSPAARLSGAARVVVGARISKSGQAVPSPGDLAGQSAAVDVGSRGLKIEIAEVVKN